MSTSQDGERIISWERSKKPKVTSSCTLALSLAAMLKLKPLMEFARYKITENDCGRRLDRVLRKFLPGLPLSAIYKMLRKGSIRLDGKKAPPAFICPLFSTVEIDSRLAPLAWQGRNKDDDFDKSKNEAFIKGVTVLETPDLLFLNKPAGIATHGEHSLCSFLPRSADSSLSFRRAALHRLDKGTTGLLAFSKTLEGARWFSKAIAEKEILKLYAAIVETRGKSLRQELWQDEDDEGSKKPIEAKVFPIANSSGLALAAFLLLTGKKHQIRRQLALRGMALLGDTRYGGSRHKGGYLLHARLMAFPKNRLTGLPECIKAPFPKRFASVASAFFGEERLEGAIDQVFSLIK